MKIAVMANPDGWHYRDLFRAANESGCFELTSARFSELNASLGTNNSQVFSASLDLTTFDAVFVRAMPPGSLQQIVFRMDLLQELTRLGTKVINSPRTMEASIDKYLSLSLLRRAGVPVPDTFVFQHPPKLAPLFEKYGQLVLKPIFGSEGRGLDRFDCPAKLEKHLSAQTKANASADFSAVDLGGVYYLQEFIPHQFDIRILVIGQEVYGMKRENEGNWISNASQGAKCVPYSIPEAEADIAKSAAAAVGGLVIGVDLVHDSEGKPLVLEVNASPGWKAISEVLKLNVADRILRAIASPSN